MICSLARAKVLPYHMTRNLMVIELQVVDEMTRDSSQEPENVVRP